LLRNGASLAEIGELLRHRDLDTTRIYAKVDECALGRLAAPWPEGVQ
jgi:site-specific recombinase XerD